MTIFLYLLAVEKNQSFHAYKLQMFIITHLNPAMITINSCFQKY